MMVRHRWIGLTAMKAALMLGALMPLVGCDRFHTARLELTPPSGMAGGDLAQEVVTLVEEVLPAYEVRDGHHEVARYVVEEPVSAGVPNPVVVTVERRADSVVVEVLQTTTGGPPTDLWHRLYEDVYEALRGRFGDATLESTSSAHRRND